MPALHKSFWLLLECSHERKHRAELVLISPRAPSNCLVWMTAGCRQQAAAGPHQVHRPARCCPCISSASEPADPADPAVPLASKCCLHNGDQAITQRTEVCLFMPAHYCSPYSIPYCSPYSVAGVDVVLDTVGGAGFEQALKSVRWGAHLLIIGFASGDVPKLPANIALVKNLTVSVSGVSFLRAKIESRVCSGSKP